jgi:hypothetical protein
MEEMDFVIIHIPASVNHDGRFAGSGFRKEERRHGCLFLHESLRIMQDSRGIHGQTG